MAQDLRLDGQMNRVETLRRMGLDWAADLIERQDARIEALRSDIAAARADERKACADFCRSLLPTANQLDDAEESGGFTFSQVANICADSISRGDK